MIVIFDQFEYPIVNSELITMSTRPVLSMIFYDPSEPNCFSPYSQMIQQANRERRQQQESKKEVIKTTITSLTEVMDNFFPEKEEKEKEKPVHVPKPASGPYKYQKEYFQHLQGNLQKINNYLEILEKQS